MLQLMVRGYEQCISDSDIRGCKREPSSTLSPGMSRPLSPGGISRVLSLFPSSYNGHKDISKFLEASAITTTTVIDAIPRRALKATGALEEIQVYV